MANGQWAVVLRHVQRLFQGEAVSGLSEGQLLERFAKTRDEGAFGAILARHGPMVLGVCRGVLDDPHDVDDAFQATFLILVKKAGALRESDLLAQWLYGVARRVALRARSNTSRRRARERPEAEVAVEPHATLDAELGELQALIREEVDRLSGNDRMAVVLCYLEGLTHEEAADRLGWPVGTVKGRLSRARDKLRGRLTRRGVALPAGAIAGNLARGASAAVPPALLRSTTLAAIQLASGKAFTAGIVSAQAITLMEGVIGTMFTTKLKVAATALVATCSIAVPGVMAFQGTGDGVGKAPTEIKKRSSGFPAAKGQPAGKMGGFATDPNGDEEARLSEQALEKAKKALIAEAMPNHHINPQVEKIPLWSRRLAEAKLRPITTEGDRKAALQAHRDRMRDLVELLTELVKGEASGTTELDVLEAKFRLIEADRWLRDGRIGDVADVNPLAQGGFGGMGAVGLGEFGGMGGNGFAGRRGGMGPIGPGGGPGGGIGEGISPGMRGMLTLNQSPADEKRNGAIRAKLEEKLAMHFASPTPLADVIKYLKDATQDEAAGFPNGLPIFIAPDGLEDAEVTMASTVTIQLEGVPLRTTLRLILHQLGLDYRIDGGVVLITERGQILIQEMKANRVGPATK